MSCSFSMTTSCNSSRGGRLAWEWEFQLCILLYVWTLSKTVNCPFLGCGSAASVCPVPVQSCSLPCTGACLGPLGMCLKVMDRKPAILYAKILQQSPESCSQLSWCSLVRGPRAGIACQLHGSSVGALIPAAINPCPRLNWLFLLPGKIQWPFLRSVDEWKKLGTTCQC